jgi:membrane protein required for colicin V production
LSDLPITIFDIAVVSVVLISVLLAVAGGFVREFLSLVSWLGAAVVAWFAYPEVRPLVSDAMGPGILADLVSGATVFVVPLILFRVVTGMLGNVVDGLGLGGLDRLVGLAFGLARGALIVCAAYLLGTYIVDERQFPPWVTQAKLEPPVRGGAIWLASLLPAGLPSAGRETVEGALDRARESRSATEPGPGPGGGYGRDSREQMNKLIEQVR